MRIKLRRWASPILTGGCQIHPGLDPDDLKRVVVLKWSVRWISEGLYTHVNIVFDGFVSWGWPHIDQRPRWTWPVVPSNSHLFYGTLSFMQLQMSRKLISSYIAAIMVCVCVCEAWDVKPVLAAVAALLSSLCMARFSCAMRPCALYCGF